MYLDLFFITICIVLITDVFKFWENFSSEIVSWITKGKIKQPIHIKILECSVCQNFWIGLIYIIICSFSIGNLLYVLLLSFSTNIIYNIFLTIENTILSIINKLNERIDN